MEREILKAVAWADLILVTAGNVLSCLLSGVIVYAAVNILWRVLQMMFLSGGRQS